MKTWLLVPLVIGLSASAFAQCGAFPCVVASVSLTNQGQNITATPLFTPATSGLFRISGYVSTSTGTNQNANWAVYLGWTDNHGSKQLTYADVYPNKPYTAYGIALQCVAGKPLLYQTALHGGGQGSGGMTYDLFITVEQIQ